MPQGDDARAGQRGDVDHRLRVEAARVVQSVAQNEPPLGIGVENFHRLSGGAGGDVPRLDRPAARHVLHRPDQSDQVQRQAQRCGEGERGDHRRRAAHVELHLIHAGGVFQRNAAAVESNALADQHDRRLRLGSAAVLQHDETRRLMAALRNCEQAPHLLAPHGGGIEQPHAERRRALGERTRLLGEKRRRADVGGQIRQITLHLGGGGHRRAVCQAALGGGRLAHRAGQHPGEGGRGRFLAGLQVIDPIERRAGELCDRPAEIIIIQLLRFGAVDGDRTAGDARARQGRRRGRPGLAPAPAVIALLRPQPGEQHARGLDAGQLANEQRVARAAGEVTTLEQSLQPARAGRIHAARLAAELCLLEHAEDQAIHADSRQALGPDPEFHALSPHR